MKITQNITAKPLDPETLQLVVQGTMVDMSKLDAIKLRNFLNKFINGDYVEDEQENELKPIGKIRPI